MLKTSFVRLLRNSAVDAFVRQAYYGVNNCDITCPATRKFTNTASRNEEKKQKEDRVVPLRSTKSKSDLNPVRSFVDCVDTEVEGGDGGDGRICFLSVFAVEFAGPDGGDGGHG